MQRSALCRSRRELSNAYFLAKFGFDTAENEPCTVPLSSLPNRASLISGAPPPYHVGGRSSSRSGRCATPWRPPTSSAGPAESLPLRPHGRRLVSAGCGKLYRARSRPYRNEILRVNMRLKALVEIYTMHSFAQLQNHIFFKKISRICQNFKFAALCKNYHFFFGKFLTKN